MISATAASSSLARAVIALRAPCLQAVRSAPRAAGWTTGWAISPTPATLRPLGQRRMLSSGTPSVGQAVSGADRSAAEALLGTTGMSLSGAGTAGRTELLQRAGGWADEKTPLALLNMRWADELPLVVLQEGALGSETTELVYEALNRNNRKPKAANHGKRPCSRWRRRRKTVSLSVSHMSHCLTVNRDGSQKMQQKNRVFRLPC